jgi:hypothetical protein
MKLSPGSRVLILLALAIVAGTGLNLLAPQVIPSYGWSLAEDLQKALHHAYFYIGDLRITPVFLIKALAFFLLRVQAPQWLASELYFEIFRAFREHGIEIPFPQRDLHLRTVSAPIPVTAVG